MRSYRSAAIVHLDRWLRGRVIIAFVLPPSLLAALLTCSVKTHIENCHGARC